MAGFWREKKKKKKRRKILRGNPPLVKLATILSGEECMTAQSGGASVVAGWGEEVGVVVPTVRTGNQGCSARGRVSFFQTFWVTRRAAALTDKLNMHVKAGRCKQHKQTVFVRILVASCSICLLTTNNDVKCLSTYISHVTDVH